MVRGRSLRAGGFRSKEEEVSGFGEQGESVTERSPEAEGEAGEEGEQKAEMSQAGEEARVSPPLAATSSPPPCPRTRRGVKRTVHQRSLRLLGKDLRERET